MEGLSEWVVRSPAEIYGLMERGGHVRATGETKMNEASSRSHAVFIVIAEQSETVYVDDAGNELTAEQFQKFMHTRGVRREQDINRLEDHVRQSFKVGKLNLVDLAGRYHYNRSQFPRVPHPPLLCPYPAVLCTKLYHTYTQPLLASWPWTVSECV